MIPLDTIICGDCLEEMKKLPDGCIDLTVTSPPYDNLRKYNGYVFDFEGIAKELFRITKSGGVVVWVVGDATIDGSETGTSFRQALYFKEIGFRLHDTMIYAKRNYIPLTHNRYEQQFEYIFVLSNGRPCTFNPIKNNCVTAGMKRNRMREKEAGQGIRPTKEPTIISNDKIKGNVWIYDIGNGHTERTSHPAPFPEQLAADHILSWSNPNDLILDPMCGSGTTCKMAKYHQRHFLGYDISEEYCEIARKRVAAVPARLDRWVEADA